MDDSEEEVGEQTGDGGLQTGRKNYHRMQHSLDDFAGFIGGVDEVGTGSSGHGQQQFLASGNPRFLRESLVQTLKRKRQWSVKAQKYLASFVNSSYRP